MCDCGCYQLGKDMERVLAQLSKIEAALGGQTSTTPGPTNGGTTTPPAADPQVVSVSAQFNTTDNDKDHDTLLDVTVKNQAGTVLASKTGIGGHWNNNSSSSVGLDLKNAPPKSQVTAGTVDLMIHPNGNDHWDFNYKIDIAYADNTSTEHSWSGLVLTQDDQSLTSSWTGH